MSLIQARGDAARQRVFPRIDSWWVGASIPGKPRALYPYVGGVGPFRAICQDVAEKATKAWPACGPAMSPPRPPRYTEVLVLLEHGDAQAAMARYRRIYAEVRADLESGEAAAQGLEAACPDPLR